MPRLNRCHLFWCNNPPVMHLLNVHQFIQTYKMRCEVEKIVRAWSADAAAAALARSPIAMPSQERCARHILYFIFKYLTRYPFNLQSGFDLIDGYFKIADVASGLFHSRILCAPSGSGWMTENNAETRLDDSDDDDDRPRSGKKDISNGHCRGAVHLCIFDRMSDKNLYWFLPQQKEDTKVHLRIVNNECHIIETNPPNVQEIQENHANILKNYKIYIQDNFCCCLWGILIEIFSNIQRSNKSRNFLANEKFSKRTTFDDT